MAKADNFPVSSKQNVQDFAISDYARVISTTLNPYEDKGLRVPMIMSSTRRDVGGIPPVIMKINPSSVTFRQPKRITKRDTQRGSTFIHWTDEDGRNNDILTMEFSGQTGNISLRRDDRLRVGNFINQDAKKIPIVGGFVSAGEAIGEGADAVRETINEVENNILDNGSTPALEPLGIRRNLSGASKMVAFWNLYDLTREPVLDSAGTPNVFYIYYSSPLFGNTFVRLEGHFSRVLDFEDIAAEPFNKTYSFGFTVESTKPSMDKIFEAIGFNVGQVFVNNLG